MSLLMLDNSTLKDSYLCIDLHVHFSSICIAFRGIYGAPGSIGRHLEVPHRNGIRSYPLPN